MTTYESPAKVNIALLVDPPRPDGYHSLHSLVQTVEWMDLLEVEEADEDALVIEGVEVDPEDNLLTRALAAVRSRVFVPPLDMRLDKTIPAGAGLGGGSSNAAATLLAAVRAGAHARSVAEELAPSVGSDVPLFLTGGTVAVSGVGDQIASEPPLSGFSIAVAVPPFEIATADVYRKWDDLEGPIGETIDPGSLPPALRDGIPIRNDLTPAAVHLVPELADFMADLRSTWGGPVAMTGSGSACFAFFSDLSEASDAATTATPMCRAARGVALRSNGVAPRT